MIVRNLNLEFDKNKDKELYLRFPYLIFNNDFSRSDE